MTVIGLLSFRLKTRGNVSFDVPFIKRNVRVFTVFQNVYYVHNTSAYTSDSQCFNSICDVRETM